MRYLVGHHDRPEGCGGRVALDSISNEGSDRDARHVDEVVIAAFGGISVLAGVGLVGSGPLGKGDSVAVCVKHQKDTRWSGCLMEFDS
jgi:hypothetical protein